MPIIYRLTNKENGKVYIGRTTLPSSSDRLDRHWLQRFENKPLYEDLRIVGKDGFILEDLMIVDDSDWNTEYEVIKEHISRLGKEKVYNVEVEGQAFNSHKAIESKYGSLEAVIHTDKCRQKARATELKRYGSLAIHLKSSYEPKSYPLMNDNKEIVVFTELWTYLRANGYPNIGKTTVKRIAHNPNKIYKSYPDLSGNITIMEGLGRNYNGKKSNI